MARAQEIIHTAGLHRESIASDGSAFRAIMRGRNCSMAGKVDGIANPSIDHTSNPASFPAFSNTNAPHRCSSGVRYSKSARMPMGSPGGGTLPSIAKSTLAHPQGHRDTTRADSSWVKYWAASAEPCSSIQRTRAPSSVDSGRSSGRGTASGIRFPGQNGPDQWLATTGLSTPLGLIASPLHRVVRAAPPTWPGQCLLRLPLRPDYARSGCYQRHKTSCGQKRPRTKLLQQR
jgi:hypothetical protein